MNTHLGIQQFHSQVAEADSPSFSTPSPAIHQSTGVTTEAPRSPLPWPGDQAADSGAGFGDRAELAKGAAQVEAVGGGGEGLDGLGGRGCKERSKDLKG